MRERMIIQSGDDAYRRWLDLCGPVAAAYGEMHDADYKTFIGYMVEGVHPAWNRLPLILNALRAGYRKVVWLDGDTLVVDPSVSIFDETPDDVPFVMTRTSGFPWKPDYATGETTEAWNDGVLVVNNVPGAYGALDWVWSCRKLAHRSHHVPSMWELNWLLDWLYGHPQQAVELHDRFNWMPFAHASPEEGAVIKAWHGMPHDQRWREFTECYDLHYGAV